MQSHRCCRCIPPSATLASALVCLQNAFQDGPDSLMHSFPPRSRGERSDHAELLQLSVGSAEHLRGVSCCLLQPPLTELRQWSVSDGGDGILPVFSHSRARLGQHRGAVGLQFLLPSAWQQQSEEPRPYRPVAMCLCHAP